jgi:NADH:ubiquinone oxidoreductase subunit 3 (subunit A)
MLEFYTRLTIFMFLSFFVSSILFAISALVALFKYKLVKDDSYECGGLTFNDFRQPFFVQFYLISVLFILFDVEITFMVSWCLIAYILKLNPFVTGL